MRPGVLLLAALVLASVVSAEDQPFDCGALLADTEEPDDQADLCWLLHEFLKGHRNCEFSQQFLGRVTSGGNSHGITKLTSDHECLKDVMIQDVTIDEISVLGAAPDEYSSWRLTLCPVRPGSPNHSAA